MANKYLIGFLILVVLSSSIYIFMPDTVKLNVDKYQSKFYVWEDDSWELAGREFVYLYKGTTKKNAMCGRDVDYSISDNITTITRTVDFCKGTVLKNTYVFDGSQSDVELFPISHDIECTNCEGYILHYEVRDITYDGETKTIESPFSFGKNMKIEWEEGSYLNKVYQQKSSDKIIIRYRPDEEVFNKEIRLFDPIASGTGTAIDPFIITTCAELNSTNENLTAYYELGNDIDCNGYTGFDPIGDNIASFTGDFNGAGYSITDLYFYNIARNYVGLFGNINGASIYNLSLIDVNITGGQYYTGGITARTQGNSLISGVYVSGSVKGGHANAEGVGCIVGIQIGNPDIIEYCGSNCTAIANKRYAGGITGTMGSGTAVINNSYAHGDVSAISTNGAGGLVGNMATAGARIDNSYATGTTTAGTAGTDGGICGINTSNTIALNSFWDTETSGDAISSCGGTGETTANMQTEATFTDASWDFTDIWWMDSYPELILINTPPDTCTYSSGDWNINCADACVISGATNLGTNDLNAYGSGTVSVDAVISNIDNVIIESGCEVVVSSNGELGVV